MTRYEWLIFVHVLGAFLLLSGSIAIGTIAFLAARRERPSEIALLLNVGRVFEHLIEVGAVVVLLFGIWLAYVDDEVPRYGLGDEWIIGALVLWAAAVALGAVGGPRAKRVREEAERAAAAGDAPTAELDRMKRDRVTFLLNWAAMVAVVAILVLMVWKPGAA